MLPSVPLTPSLLCHSMGCPPGRVHLSETQWAPLPKAPYLWHLGNSCKIRRASFWETRVVMNSALFIPLFRVVWQARLPPFGIFWRKAISPHSFNPERHVMLPRCSIDASFSLMWSEEAHSSSQPADMPLQLNNQQMFHECSRFSHRIWRWVVVMAESFVLYLCCYSNFPEKWAPSTPIIWASFLGPFAKTQTKRSHSNIQLHIVHGTRTFKYTAFLNKCHIVIFFNVNNYTSICLPQWSIFFISII